MPKKSTIVGSLLLAMIFLLVFISFASGYGETAADPLSTSEADESQLRLTATAVYPQMGSMSGSGSMTGMSSGACPMMGSGAMTGSSDSMSGAAMPGGSMSMSGMSGMGSMSMSGMSGMGSMSMPGMTDMGSMSMPGTSGMGSMSMPGTSGMGSMSTQGTMGMSNMTAAQMNDLMGYSFYGTNPWWLLGWFLVLAMIVGVIAGAVIAIYWVIRHFRRSEPVATAS